MFPAFAQGQILAVAVDDQFGFVEAELSALVSRLSSTSQATTCAKKQIMAAQQDDLRHLALKIQRAFFKMGQSVSTNPAQRGGHRQQSYRSPGRS